MHWIQTLGSCNLEHHDALLQCLAYWDFQVHQWESTTLTVRYDGHEIGWCYWGYVLFDDGLLCPIICFPLPWCSGHKVYPWRRRKQLPIETCWEIVHHSWHAAFGKRGIDWFVWGHNGCWHEQLPRCLVRIIFGILVSHKIGILINWSCCGVPCTNTMTMFP